MTTGVSIDSVRAQAFEIPTDKPEADGTIAWNSTTLVLVEISGGGETGVGYTYSGASIVELIGGKLASAIKGQDALSPQAAWLAMQRAVRNLGREGLGRDRNLRCRCRDPRSQGAPTRFAIVQDAGQLPRQRADLRQRRFHHLFGR